MRTAFFLASFAIAMLTSKATWAEDFIILQSTTSTQNSGLFEHILPRFTEVTGIEVRVVAVGTGQALKNAANGDGDVVLVHAPEAEAEFVDNGFGVERQQVMSNDFVIVGPDDDSAGIRDMENATRALRRIGETDAVFVSRGDSSGTHIKERELWAGTGVDLAAASGDWYREIGAGMGAALNAAVAMDAYTLSDRGTWLSFENKADHEILVEGDPRLFNAYGVILVDPDRHPHVKEELGQRFIDWLTGPQGQAAIASFRIDGQQLFQPDAEPAPENDGES